jgi:hypothetical protein
MASMTQINVDSDYGLRLGIFPRFGYPLSPVARPRGC